MDQVEPIQVNTSKGFFLFLFIVEFYEGVCTRQRVVRDVKVSRKV